MVKSRSEIELQPGLIGSNFRLVPLLHGNRSERNIDHPQCNIFGVVSKLPILDILPVPDPSILAILLRVSVVF